MSEEIATHFAWCIPTNEEEMRDVVDEIIRIRGERKPDGGYTLDRDIFTSIRDDLQCLVNFMTERLEQCQKPSPK